MFRVNINTISTVTPPELITVIHSKLIKEYQDQYDLNSFEHFEAYFLEKGKDNDVDPINTDFFEHCIIETAGSLLQLHELNDSINLGFLNNNSVYFGTKGPLMLIRLGIPDKEFAEKNSVNKKRLEQLLIAIDKLSYSSEDSEYYNYRQKNYQYSFTLVLSEATKSFITNPFFTAQYIIDHPNEIKDTVSLNAACRYLTRKMDQFIGLKKGIPLATIDKLKQGLHCIAVETALVKKNHDQHDYFPEEINDLIHGFSSYNTIPQSQSAIYLKLLTTYRFFHEADFENDQLAELRHLLDLSHQYPQEAVPFLVNVGLYFVRHNQFAAAWHVLYPLANNKNIKDQDVVKDIKNALANLLTGSENDLDLIFTTMAKSELLTLKYQLIIHFLKEEASKNDPLATMLTKRAIHYLISKDDRPTSDLISSIYNNISCVFYSLTVLKNAGQELINLYKKQIDQLKIANDVITSDTIQIHLSEPIQNLEELLSTTNDSIDYLTAIVILLRELLNHENIRILCVGNPILQKLSTSISHDMIIPYELFSHDDVRMQQFIHAVTPEQTPHQTYIRLQTTQYFSGPTKEITHIEERSFIKMTNSITEYCTKKINFIPSLVSIANENNAVTTKLTDNSSYLFAKDNVCNKFEKVIASYFDRPDITIVLNKGGMKITHAINGSIDKLLHEFIQERCGNVHIKYNEKNNCCTISLNRHSDIEKFVNELKFPLNYLYENNGLHFANLTHSEHCLVM